MKLRLLSSYFFSLECFYLYLFLCLFFTSTNQLPPLLAFFSVVLIGNFCLYFILKQNELSENITYLIAISAGGISYLLGFNRFISLICAIFLLYRIKAFSKDSSLSLDERKNFPILFYCTGFIVLLSGYINDFIYMNILYGILIAYTILFSLGRFLQQAILKFKHKNILGLFITLSIGGIIAGIITIFLPALKFGAMKIISGLVNVAGFLLIPFFNFIETIVIKPPKPKGEQEELRLNLGEIRQVQSKHYLLQDVPTWTWILFFLIILILIGFIIRKYKPFKIEKRAFDTSIEIEQLSTPEQSKRKRSFFKQSAPSNHVRKLIYQIQKYASKHHLGRYEYETVNEWFKRVNFSSYEELLSGYEEIRYGKGELKHSKQYYENEYQKLKEEIKSRSKEEKQ